MTEPIPPASGPAVTAPPHVLVIDDDPSIRAMLSAWLQTEGCRFQVATDARSARALLDAADFDLLLCDVHLPDDDGPGIVEALAGRNRGVPVIFLTGEPTLETAIRSVQLRVVAYLIKPPDLRELRRHMQAAVATHRERRAIGEDRRRLREWDAELARLEKALEGSPSSRSATGIEHMRLTLHQLGALLQDLDRSIANVVDFPEGREAVSQLDLVSALRRTVAVLEATRANFKSKALGELRREVEAVLQRLDVK